MVIGGPEGTGDVSPGHGGVLSKQLRATNSLPRCRVDAGQLLPRPAVVAPDSGGHAARFLPPVTQAGRWPTGRLSPHLRCCTTARGGQRRPVGHGTGAALCLALSRHQAADHWRTVGSAGHAAPKHPRRPGPSSRADHQPDAAG